MKRRPSLLALCSPVACRFAARSVRGARAISRAAPRAVSPVVLLAALVAAPAVATLSGCALLGEHERRATVELLPAPGMTARGTVTFVDGSDGVQVTYNLAGLPAESDHGLHVHDAADCIAAGPAGIGAVFNPLPVPAGATRGTHAEGDLPNVHADANGVANGFFVVPDLALDGVRSIVGHVLVVHRDPDDPYAMAPVVTDGPRLACGVIRR